MTALSWTDLLLLAAAWWLARPLQVLLHEVGHALAACCLAGRRSRISLGEFPRFFHRFGPVSVQFSVDRWDRGACRFDSTQLSPRTLSWILASGAGLNLLSVAVGLGLLWAVPALLPVVFPLVFYGLKLGLLAILPTTKSGVPWETDGSAIVRLLRSG